MTVHCFVHTKVKFHSVTQNTWKWLLFFLAVGVPGEVTKFKKRDVETLQQLAVHHYHTVYSFAAGSRGASSCKFHLVLHKVKC